MTQNDYCERCHHYMGNKKVSDGIFVVCGNGAKHLVWMSVVDCTAFKVRKPASPFKRWLKRRMR